MMKRKWPPLRNICAYTWDTCAKYEVSVIKEDCSQTMMMTLDDDTRRQWMTMTHDGHFMIV